MIEVTTLQTAVQKAHLEMVRLEQVLNQADAVIGDGDTGGMLARVLAGMAQLDLTTEKDLGMAFASLARSALANTGSSLGTLFATGLLSIAKETRGSPNLDWARLGELLAGARDAMLARGGASLGDKTVLDALDAVAHAVKGAISPVEVADHAVLAAKTALQTFRSKPCNVGRARMFAEKSIGIDDPGMLAFVELTIAIAR
ncbi:MAG: dihydroxyacetone kinase subunit L [Pseudomonas sp.]